MPFSKYSPKQKKLAAVAGNKKKIEALPNKQAKLREALIDMRMHIDALSRTLVREGYITGKAAFGITANEGYIYTDLIKLLKLKT